MQLYSYKCLIAFLNRPYVFYIETDNIYCFETQRKACLLLKFITGGNMDVVLADVITRLCNKKKQPGVTNIDLEYEMAPYCSTLWTFASQIMILLNISVSTRYAAPYTPFVRRSYCCDLICAQYGELSDVDDNIDDWKCRKTYFNVVFSVITNSCTYSRTAAGEHVCKGN